VLAPHTGQPAITVPMGFTDSGLPLGLQLLARPFDEHIRRRAQASTVGIRKGRRGSERCRDLPSVLSKG
ncbi:MAG: amidase family protein, partial [Halochromatium sp.]|uniref:amidase family protein n=1 Tax=Halochromatium sp. TaxID=2049430 RepID=UPI003978FC61